VVTIVFVDVDDDGAIKLVLSPSRRGERLKYYFLSLVFVRSNS
jgi:hypothetical protein